MGISWIRWGTRIAGEEGLYCSVASSDGRDVFVFRYLRRDEVQRNDKAEEIV